MKRNNLWIQSIVFLLLMQAWACKIPELNPVGQKRNLPEKYLCAADSANMAWISWRSYFTDSGLISLIDTALLNNQELNIMIQEIEMARNEIRARKGEYLPFAGLKGGAGTEKAARYTRTGAIDESLEIKPGKPFPEPFSDFMAGVDFSWELDIWRKLRNSRDAAAARYLSSIEGRNFMITRLISEIAESYYELLALDKQLEILEKNIEIQKNALEIIKQQKLAARVSQLAVNRFEAQLLNTQNRQYEIRQRIVETENHINFLTGRFPSPIKRNAASFDSTVFRTLSAGFPAQLLVNRPDIKAAEQGLLAAGLDVKAARANFLPSIRISATAGLQAFNPAVWVNPASLMFNALGDLASPLINRNGIRAAYLNAGARQQQALYQYDRTVLMAYIEVLNQLSAIDNYSKSVETKAGEVEILTRSIEVSDNLFKSARADYMEVLLTQREALESKMEYIEIRNKQLRSEIYIYRALGGGWK